MQVTGKHRLALAREELFPRLLDPDVLRACIPGCEELVREAEGVYRARLSLGFGPLKGTFTGGVRLTEVSPPQGYTMQLQGEGKIGFLRGSTRMELAAVGDAETELRYQGDVQVGGLLASVGARLLPGAARLLAEQFFTSLEKVLREGR